MKLHTGLVVRCFGAVAPDTHVTGGDPLHSAIFVVQHFSGRKSGKDFHAQRLGLLAEPLGYFAQADNIIAVILEAFGQEPVRGGTGAFLRKEKEPIFRDLGFQRSPFFFPVGNQFGERLGIHDRARQDMGADFRGFFKDTDVEFLPFVVGELFQPDGSRQASRPGADDDDVVFH